jgi:hypothetical protein
MTNSIKFRASFPAIQSAIIISGDGSGLRLKLDVPEIDLLQSLEILAMRNTAFTVTIDPIEDRPKQPTNDGTPAIKRTAAKKRE